jgi:hypothetical protein
VTSVSDGAMAARAEATPAGSSAQLSTSPVDSSTLATAAWPPRIATAASRLAPRASSRPSSVSVPGVTTRTTSRRTIDLPPRFLASAGSSICSQTATRWPARISLARYASAACTGTPAIGMGSPPCAPRAVSVIPSAAEAFTASSKNSS